MFASPLFAPLAPWLARLGLDADSRALTDLARAAGVRTASGHPVVFVPPPDDGLGYEARIWQRGAVATRPGNRHDFFNALVWLAFPGAKATLNARHMATMGAPGAARGPGRDTLTHFDECGQVVVARDAPLLDLLRAFQWKALFWSNRERLRQGLRFMVFGHATYEQLLAPFRGLTAKAILVDVGDDWFRQSPDAQRMAIDRHLADTLTAGGYGHPRDLQPVPLLGIPGLTPENENENYYDDTGQFRPGRWTGKHSRSATKQIASPPD